MSLPFRRDQRDQAVLVGPVPPRDEQSVPMPAGHRDRLSGRITWCVIRSPIRPLPERPCHVLPHPKTAAPENCCTPNNLTAHLTLQLVT